MAYNALGDGHEGYAAPADGIENADINLPAIEQRWVEENIYDYSMMYDHGINGASPGSINNEFSNGLSTDLVNGNIISPTIISCFQNADSKG